MTIAELLTIAARLRAIYTTGSDAVIPAAKENEAWDVPVPAAREEADKVLAHISPALQNPISFKIGQNIKFDILVVRKYGIRIAGPLFDTMIAHYLLNPELRHGMDYLAETYLKY